MADLKYPGEYITREIFSSQVAIDGRYSELTQEERDNIVKKIYKNTKLMLKYNVLIPLKLNHDDQEPLLRGYVQDIKLKKKKMTIEGETTQYYAIIAKMFLFKDFLDIYNTGRIPNISAEIPEYGNLPNGKRLDDNLMAVAFLGTDSPAMPWLDQQYDRQDYQYLYSNNLLFTKLKFNKKYINKEFINMPTLDELKVVFDDFWSTIESMFQEADSPDEAPPEEMPMEATSQPQYDRKRFDECSNAFDRFANENKLPITFKEDFVRVAYTQGLDFAKRIYSSQIAPPKPPSSKPIKSDSSIVDSNIVRIAKEYKIDKKYGEQYERYLKERGNV